MARRGDFRDLSRDVSVADPPAMAPGGPPPPAANQPPSISGTPPTALLVNEDYDFRPSASDPDGDDLTFSVQNRPDWATFETATGRLHGRPGAGDVGQFTGIAISVSDGTASDSLATFAISVNQTAAGKRHPVLVTADNQCRRHRDHRSGRLPHLLRSSCRTLSTKLS